MTALRAGAARRGRVTLAVLAAASLGACRETGSHLIPDGSASQRDSAGVTIVESTGGTWTRGERWTIDPSPSLEIGSTTGAEAYLFGYVSAALRLRDGRILVVDNQAKAVRAYSSDGLHLGDWATEGEGPGEIQRPHGLIRLPGDSVAVSEFIGPVSVYGPDGTFARKFILPSDIRSLEELRALGDVALTSNPRGVIGALGPGTYLVRFRGVIPFGVDSPERTPLMRVDEAGERELLVTLTSGAFEAWREGPAGRYRRTHFDPWLGIAMHPDGFVTNVGDAFGYTLHGVDGAPERVARLLAPRVPVSDQLKARWRANRSQWWGRSLEPGVPPGRLQQIYEETPFPDSLPALEGIRVDPAGNVWGQGYPDRDWPTPSPRQFVFATDGSFLGTVEAPGGLRITDIGDDYVLGVWQDENEVDYIRLHRLIKP